LSGDDRAARAEVLEGYFRLQLMLADAVAERTGQPLADCVLSFTNLHRRFGLGVPGAGPVAPVWERYVAGLAAARTLAERVALTKAAFIEGLPESQRARFGCFTHDPPDADGVVRIHFSSQDSEGDVGPLASWKTDRRVDELRRMFAAIRAAHPDAKTVRGSSWLYNLEAYRRLFPPAYAASRREPPRVGLNGTSSWGQLIDHRGYVKPDVEAAFLRNLRQDLDPAEPWRVFPLRPLITRAPIETFYVFYESD